MAEEKTSSWPQPSDDLQKCVRTSDFEKGDYIQQGSDLQTALKNEHPHSAPRIPVQASDSAPHSGLQSGTVPVEFQRVQIS